MQRRTLMKAALTAVTLSALQTTALAENTVLKIGFVGVTSGPAAAWGISNQRSMEARAAWINETGGYTIGGTTYDIEIVSFDDQKDPKRASIMSRVQPLTTARRPCALSRNPTGSCISPTPFPSRCIKRQRPTLCWGWLPTINLARRSTNI